MKIIVIDRVLCGDYELDGDKTLKSANISYGHRGSTDKHSDKGNVVLKVIVIPWFVRLYKEII